MILIKQIVAAGIPLLEIVLAERETEMLPTVFFYHGWTSCKESVVVDGYELARRGFRTILPDAYLHGERNADPEVPKPKTVFWDVVSHSIAELPNLKDYYVKKGLTDPDRIGVSGLSMGGITTSAMLTQFTWIKSAVILMGNPAPILFSKSLLTSKWVEGMELSIDKSEFEAATALLEPISLDRKAELINGRPILFWHGTADELVPYQQTYDFYLSIKDQPYAENVSFTTAENLGHVVPYAATVEMADFFEKYL